MHKIGTRVEFRVSHPRAPQRWEPARIVRPMRGDSLPAGTYILEFAHGGRLAIDERDFRVVPKHVR